jgi:hypothetical protein
MYERGVAQLALTLLTLFGKNVPFVGLGSFKLTGTGSAKPFSRPAIGFQLWHYKKLRIRDIQKHIVRPNNHSSVPPERTASNKWAKD